MDFFGLCDIETKKLADRDRVCTLLCLYVALTNRSYGEHRLPSRNITNIGLEYTHTRTRNIWRNVCNIFSMGRTFTQCNTGYFFNTFNYIIFYWHDNFKPHYDFITT